MAKSFPYILQSGAFKQVLAEDLGMQSVPGTIEAEVMENTNLFTLKVTESNQNLHKKILEQLLRIIRQLLEFVIWKFPADTDG